MNRHALVLAAVWFGLSGVPVQARGNTADTIKIKILHLPGGVRFGLIGERAAEPSPTLFVFASSLEGNQKEPVYLELPRLLLRQGFLSVMLDPPAHGADRRPGEPKDMKGWQARFNRGEDFIGEFTANARSLLDYLVKEGYTDPGRVAACGASRGAFLAFHFAAVDTRIRCVAGIAPLTDLTAPATLDLFSGKPEQANKLSATALVPKLVGRPVWICIGNHDPRVDTDLVIAFARALVRASAQGKRADAVIPVELIVAPTAGHTAIANTDPLLASWILQQFGMAGPPK